MSGDGKVRVTMTKSEAIAYNLKLWSLANSQRRLTLQAYASVFECEAVLEYVNRMRQKMMDYELSIPEMEYDAPRRKYWDDADGIPSGIPVMHKIVEVPGNLAWYEVR